MQLHRFPCLSYSGCGCLMVISIMLKHTLPVIHNQQHSLHNTINVARLDIVPSMLEATQAISPAWTAEAIVIINRPLDIDTPGSLDVKS